MSNPFIYVPSRRLRETTIHLSEAQNHRCAYCKLPMEVYTDRPPGSRKKKKAPVPPNLATLEHVVPRSLGGSETDWNYVAACHFCNTLRQNFPDALVFERLVMELLQNELVRSLWHNHTLEQEHKIRRHVWGLLAAFNKDWAVKYLTYLKANAR